MKITQQEDALFAEWRENRPGFVADGVANEEGYLASSPRLLFILKEVNDPDGSDWDLREFMRDGGRPQTWNNIARWTEGVRNISVDLPWSDLVKIDEPRRKHSLCSIAAINLKKSPGDHTADSSIVATVAAEDKEFLNRQFALYAPDNAMAQVYMESGTWSWLMSAEFKERLALLDSTNSEKYRVCTIL